VFDFTSCVDDIHSRFNKEQLNAFNAITCFDCLHLATLGYNDREGFQIFTPEFIVKQMTDAIGDDLLDFSKTVLEPTSGDGAFTTYILQKRLETIKENFEIESLKALSTIYSIEMDNELIILQRNNILTLLKNYIKEHNLIVDYSYYDMAKCIITLNFVWAMFNYNSPIGGFLVDVAYKMPNAEKKAFKPINFAVWNIADNNITVKDEGVDIW